MTNTVLIANAAAMQDPEKRRKIEQIVCSFRALLRAESLVCLKMNAPAASWKPSSPCCPPELPTVARSRRRMALLKPWSAPASSATCIPSSRSRAEGILEYALTRSSRGNASGGQGSALHPLGASRPQTPA